MYGRFCHSFQSRSQNALFLDVFPSRLRIDFFRDILKQTCVYEFMKSSCKPKQTFWNYANYKSNRTSYNSVTWKRKGIKAKKKKKKIKRVGWCFLLYFSFISERIPSPKLADLSGASLTARFRPGGAKVFKSRN